MEEKEARLVLIGQPLVAVAISFCFLAVLLYRRVNLGVVLPATALFLGILTLDWLTIPQTIWTTSTDLLTVSVTLATFGIMLLSQLYKETKLINTLSDSLSRIINNPKIVLAILPAVIGFLPVAGGALMSAPLVDSEAERLGLKPAKKAYVNFWFRHTIFPVYPLSQVLIVAAGLSGVTVLSIIIRQIPVVTVMAIVGYLIGFSKIRDTKKTETQVNPDKTRSNLKSLIVSFSPILATIIVAITLGLIDPSLSRLGFDALIAILVGLVLIVVITKPDRNTSTKPFKSWGIYGITAAAYGAFLLRNMLIAAGIPDIFTSFAASNSVDTTLLLIVVPAALGMLTASALGGVSISVPILAGIIALSPRTASLIYMSAYLGYMMSPTHLCLTFTADYFKCSLEKIYKYAIPSFLATFATTLLIYFLL